MSFNIFEMKCHYLTLLLCLTDLHLAVKYMLIEHPNSVTDSQSANAVNQSKDS